MDDDRAREQIMKCLMPFCGQNKNHREPPKKHLYHETKCRRQNIDIPLPVQPCNANSLQMMPDGAPGYRHHRGLQDKYRNDEQRELRITIGYAGGTANHHDAKHHHRQNNRINENRSNATY